MKKRIIFVASMVALFVPAIAKAHCPLCTAGAGALAVLAASMGVSLMAVGVFMGAFAIALGLWMARLIKKTYIPHQRLFITLLVSISTIVPMLPFVSEYMPVNVYWFGVYGNPFNKTYLIHSFVSGSILGAIIMLVSPAISKQVKKIRKGKLIPYQGIIITLLLLSLTSVGIQFGI